MCCSCLHHLLPWVASCSLVMHNSCLCIMSCLCVVCLLCCVLLLDSSRFVAIMRIRSSTLVRLHGFIFFMDSFFFLAGFQARWPLPWISLLSLLCKLLRSIALLRYLSPVYQASLLPWTSNLWHLSYANCCLSMLPLLLSPSYSVASCKWSWRLLHGGQGYVRISQYLLYLLIHLYIW